MLRPPSGPICHESTPEIGRPSVPWKCKSSWWSAAAKWSPFALFLVSPSPSWAQVQDVVWRNAVGVSVAGSNLTKTAATAFGNAGAVSTQTLEFGGYVEFSTTATNTRQMIGLGSGDADQNYADIEFAIDLSSGALGIYESGAYCRRSLESA